MSSNKHNKPFSFRDRLKSFSYSFQGLFYFFREEHNARIHLLMALLALILSIWLPMSSLEWIIIIICIVLVIAAEIINTAIERLCNAVHPEYHPLIKQCKDLASAAVLVMAIGSAVCGGVIFIPKIIDKIASF